MRKRYDLAVKTGEYEDNMGNTKGRWQNVGQVMEDDKGGRFILLKRTFNPAGVPVKSGRDSIVLSMFEPKDGEGRGGGYGSAPSHGNSGGGQYEHDGNGNFRRMDAPADVVIDAGGQDVSDGIPF